MDLPATGRCYTCGTKLPERPAGTRGPARRWCVPCGRRHRSKLWREREDARRAWRGLRRGEIVPDGKLRLDDRRRRPRAKYLLVTKRCVDCGDVFNAGHRAERCLSCRERYQRTLNHERYLRAKARRAANAIDRKRDSPIRRSREGDNDAATAIEATV